jgi:hypothetical protein
MHTLISDIEHLDNAIPALRAYFANLTRAHAWFEREGNLRAVSVSDVFEDGSIDATFHGVLVKFRLLYTYTVESEPIGRVVVLHCHSVFGKFEQAQIAEFSINTAGFTNLPPDGTGRVPNMTDDPGLIVLTFVRKALNDNASLSG